jgi:hypothetical protein
MHLPTQHQGARAKEFFFFECLSGQEAVGRRNNGARSGTKDLKRLLKEKERARATLDQNRKGFPWRGSVGGVSGAGCGKAGASTQQVHSTCIDSMARAWHLVTVLPDILTYSQGVNDQ